MCSNGHKVWEYVEFGYRCEPWNKFYRAIYTLVCSDGKQRLLDFARPDNVIVTNIGVNRTVLTNCSAREQSRLIKAVMNNLQFDVLWQRSQTLIPIIA